MEFPKQRPMLDREGSSVYSTAADDGSATAMEASSQAATNDSYERAASQDFSTLRFSTHRGNQQRHYREPFKVKTDQNNKSSVQFDVSTPPSTAGPCFPAGFPSLMSSKEMVHSPQCCGCFGQGCKSCFRTSKSKMMKGFMSLPPSQDPDSNPVIEDLGLTLKPRDRINKYSMSSSAMNPPGNSIPTPAPSRKKQDHMTTFSSKMKEKEISWMKSLKGQSTSTTDEDAFLPNDFDAAKENGNNNPRLYTEADLQKHLVKALKSQENQLKEAYASDNPAVREMQKQMQEQIERQGELWNKDLNDRMEAVRKNYKKKQASLKARIQELEDKCQFMQEKHEQEREEHHHQTDILRQELESLQQHNSNSDRDLSQKWKELVSQNSMDKEPQDSIVTEKEEIVRSLEARVTELKHQLEHENAKGQSGPPDKQLTDMEQQLKHLQKLLSEQSEGRKEDKRKIQELEQQKGMITQELSRLKDELERIKENDSDTIENRENCTSRERMQQKTLEEQNCEAQRKGKKLQGMVQEVTKQAQKTRQPSLDSNTTGKEATLNSEILKLNDHLKAAEQNIERAKVETEKEAQVRHAMALEVSRLSSQLHSLQETLRSNDGSDGLKVMAEAQQISNSPSMNTLRSTSRNIDALDLMVIKARDSKGAESAPSTDGFGFCCGPELFPCYSNIPLQGAPQKLLLESESFTRGVESNVASARNSSEVGEKIEEIRKQLSAIESKLPENTESQTYESLEALSEDPSFTINVAEFRSLIQVINEQLKDLRVSLPQSGMDHDVVNRKLLSIEKKSKKPFGMQLLTKQLERQRDELSRMEKQRLDETRNAQKLSEQLRNLEEQLRHRRGETDSLAVVSNSLNQAGPTNSGIEDEVEGNNQKLQYKDEEFVKEQNLLVEKEAELMEIKVKLEKGTDQAVKFQQQILALQQEIAAQQQNIASKDCELEQLRSQLKQIMERHGASYEGILIDQDTQVQELLVMLELKQRNEHLSNEIEKMKAEMEECKKDGGSKYGEKLDKKNSKQETHRADLLERQTELLEAIRHKLVALLGEIGRAEAQHSISPSTEIADGASTIPQMIEKVEHHIFKAWNDFTQMKVTELTSQKKQITELKQKLHHHQEASEANEEERTRLKNLIEELEQELKSKCRTVESKSSEIDVLNKDVLQLKEDASEASMKHSQVAQDLDDAVKMVKAFESENADLKKQVTVLETQAEKLEREKELEVEGLSEAKKNLETARKECSKLKEELRDSKSNSTKMESKISELEALLESNQNECQRLNNMLQMKSSEYEQKLLARTTELEEKSRATISQFEQQVRQVREDHAKEIDELLAQLDLIEAEEKERCNEKEILVKEKDCVISALGSQLADSQSRMAFLEKSLEEQKYLVARAREETSTAKSETGKLKAELETLREEHVKSAEEERIKSERACEEAREETIQEAEAQFQQMNSLYRTLKKEYNNASAKAKELEDELKETRKGFEKVKEEQESKIAALEADLEKLKTDHAKADTDAARQAKEYLSQLEKLKGTERDLETKLSDAEFANKSIQKMLANVVADKEKLTAENEELKAVCEEAMSLASSYVDCSSTT